MTRPHFQNGRLLRTSDFVAEQTYHLTAHRQHNTTGHLWGIATGLDIVLNDGQLAVEPGTAIDGFGRDVILANARSLNLRNFDIQGIDAVDVWVVYDRRRDPATGEGVDQLVDTASVELTAAADFDPRQPPGVDPVDLAGLAGRPPPDDPARRWPIYLGRVTRDVTHPEIPPLIEPDRRPYIGLVGSAVQTPDGDPWLEYTAGTHASVAIGRPIAAGADSPLMVSVDDGVEFNSRLTVDGELVLRGGSLALVPPDPVYPGLPPVTPEWSLSHAEDDVAHDLRVAMPPAGSGSVPNRLVVGVWKDGSFTRCLSIDEDGTVIIAGNVVVGGGVRAPSVQEAQLSAEAKAYLAGLQATSLLSLFAITPDPEID